MQGAHDSGVADQHVDGLLLQYLAKEALGILH